MCSLKLDSELDAFHPYKYWEDQSTYTRTLVVAQQHPNASDDNPGTPQAPLYSIQAAADQAQPDTSILIHEGLYREMVQPARGGSGPKAMIRYEAAQGEHVEIRGSVPLEVKWSRPRQFEDGFVNTTKSYALSQRTWLTNVPESLFLPDYDVLSLPNVTPKEVKHMEWMEPVVGAPPYDLPRLMLFQDGTRLTQMHHKGDVSRLPGSFWVDQAYRQLMVHPIGSINPNQASFEIAIQPHLFCPQDVGFDHIALSGLHFSHCANGFLRGGTGAVTTRGGGYWLIENCSITQCNSSGLEFGDRAFEYRDPRQIAVRPWKLGHGHNIVRNNHISECGTAGIRCLHVTEGRVTDNHIHHCGWQEAEYYYECAGIKMLVNKHTLVKNNHIHDIAGGCGIWLDWDNKYSRVTENRIENSHGFQGAIFIEASPTPNLIDNNIIKNYDGPGIFGGDSSNQIYRDNEVECTGPGIILKCHTDRLVGSPRQKVTCTNNQVIGNKFEAGEDHVVEEEGNHFEH